MSDTTIQVPPWHRAAADYIASANATLTNATELTHKLGSWNWTRSKRVDISFGDVVTSDNVEKAGVKATGMEKGSPTKARIILQGKENIIPI